MPGKKGGRGSGTTRAWRERQANQPKPKPRAPGINADIARGAGNVLDALKGIAENLQTADDIFRPKKK
jgi:hypothetical protein